MYGILISALWTALGFLMKFVFRSVIIKFGVFFALFFVSTEFTAYILSSGILPTASQAQSYAGQIPSGVAYVLGIFSFYQGMSLVISAYATRFVIRRIPKL